MQTHVHLDHMDSFATSKGLQDIFLSEPTRDLLISEFNAELPYRENIHALAMGNPHPVGEEQLTLRAVATCWGRFRLRFSCRTECAWAIPATSSGH